MRRMIPSTLALVAFDAAARHQSFSRAGDELHHTQSAICRQIQGLEDFLGVRLFHRAKRRVTLTDAGQAYWVRIRSHLAALEQDTLDLMSRQGKGGVVELAVLPTFATKWLIPRMPAFQQAHPDVVLNLTTRTRPFLFEDSGFDAAIHFGDPVWPGAQSELLMPEEVVPVCSPALRPAGVDFNHDPAALADYPLLHQTTRPESWRAWFDAHGVDAPQAMRGPRFELFSMLIQAATVGLGVALTPKLFVEEELAQGSLVALANPMMGDKHYYLVFPERKAESESLGVFRQWLQQQAAG